MGIFFPSRPSLKHEVDSFPPKKRIEMSKLQSEDAADKGYFMKTRKNELDVDFIGGAGPLTKEEEKRISEVIRALKAKRLSSRRSTKKKVTKKKETV